MTMFDTQTIQQLANAFYQKSVAPPVAPGTIPNAAPAPALEIDGATALPQPAAVLQMPSRIVAPLEAAGAAMSACDGGSKLPPLSEPGYDASPAYYFLKQQLPPSHGNLPGGSTARSYGIEAIRKDFPILQRPVNGRQLIWFDNAATTQKPQSVLDDLNRFYRESNSNVHRGAHTLAGKATRAYEGAREKIQKLIGAAQTEEIIFVRGTTEAINLVAQTYGRMKLAKGDEILISVMEHHSNIVPWQLVAEATGAQIRSIPMTDPGEVALAQYEKLLSRRTRIVAITHVSNVLGTINPVRAMIEMAHAYGACVLVDGAQSVPHFKVAVRELDADFYAFSGHKMYGPTGIGALYGKKALLEEIPPWQGGGSMIKTVSFAGTTFNALPYKFEAGTANIADAVALGTAADYLQKIGLAEIERYESEITAYAMNRLAQIPELRLIGTAPRKTSVVSFLMQGIAPEDLARDLDQEGIAVRAGHHCAQPLMQHYGIPGTVRVSLGLYNTRAEIDFLADALLKAARRHF